MSIQCFSLTIILHPHYQIFVEQLQQAEMVNDIELKNQYIRSLEFIEAVANKEECACDNPYKNTCYLCSRIADYYTSCKLNNLKPILYLE